MSKKTLNLILTIIGIILAVVLVTAVVILIVQKSNDITSKRKYGSISEKVDNVIENHRSDESKGEIIWERKPAESPEESEPSGSEPSEEEPSSPSGSEPGESEEPSVSPSQESPEPSGEPSESVDASSEEPVSSAAEVQHSSLYQEMKMMLDELRKVNSEVFGYLIVEISNKDGLQTISYPVMQSKTNDNYYLTHMYDGSENRNGSIFTLSFVYDKLSKNQNIPVFGHNMQSGAMFHKLLTILSSRDSFYGKKGVDDYYVDITFFNENGIYTFDLFSVYYTTSDDDYCTTYFNTVSEFVEFCDGLQEKSMWKKDLEFYGSDTIMTFSTCTNGIYGDDRIAFHSILTGIFQ